jgi:frataxin-like iron-binding protein CyaY
MLDFSIICEKELLNILIQIESIDIKSVLDCDYQDGVLTIKPLSSDNFKYFVVNRHNSSGKIWYSSPISGVDYFSFDEGLGVWKNKEQKQLKSIVAQEMSLYIEKLTTNQ